MNLPRHWLLFVVLAVAFIFGFLFMLVATGAESSSCHSIRDMDKHCLPWAVGSVRSCTRQKAKSDRRPAEVRFAPVSGIQRTWRRSPKRTLAVLTAP